MLLAFTSATIGSISTSEFTAAKRAAPATALGSCVRGIGLGEQGLPMQIVAFHEIAIDDPHKANSGTDQQIGRHAAQGAATDDQHPSFAQLLLARFTKREQNEFGGDNGRDRLSHKSLSHKIAGQIELGGQFGLQSVATRAGGSNVSSLHPWRMAITGLSQVASQGRWSLIRR